MQGSLRVGIVTGRETAVNREAGGPPVRLLQVQITDHNDVQTVQLVGQAGEEVNPPNGTLVLLLPGGQAFKLSAGTSDWVVPIMDVGGKRIYAVDPTGGVICDLQLKPDGSIVLAGPEASLSMLPDGAVEVTNGAASFTMSPAGEFTFTGTAANFECPVSSTVSVTAPSVVGTTDVTFGGKSAGTHTHGGVQTGAGNTGVPN